MKWLVTYVFCCECCQRCMGIEDEEVYLDQPEPDELDAAYTQSVLGTIDKGSILFAKASTLRASQIGSNNRTSFGFGMNR